MVNGFCTGSDQSSVARCQSNQVGSHMIVVSQSNGFHCCVNQNSNIRLHLIHRNALNDARQERNQGKEKIKFKDIVVVFVCFYFIALALSNRVYFLVFHCISFQIVWSLVSGILHVHYIFLRIPQLYFVFHLTTFCFCFNNFVPIYTPQFVTV